MRIDVPQYILDNTFWKIAAGHVPTPHSNDSELQHRIDFNRLNAEYDLGIEVTKQLKSDAVTNVYNTLCAWINSPNGRTHDTFTAAVAGARASAKEVQFLLRNIQKILEKYVESTFPYEENSTRHKKTILASCEKQIEIVTLILQTIIELEQVATYYETSRNQSIHEDPMRKRALEDSKKIHITFVSWRRSLSKS